jgi:hypothetical protein
VVAVAATKAQFLARLTFTRSLSVLRHRPDGTFLSVIGGIKVRFITAAVTVTCHDGTSYGGVYRVATTLLDHRGAHPRPYRDQAERDNPVGVRQARPAGRPDVRKAQLPSGRR